MNAGKYVVEVNGADVAYKTRAAAEAAHPGVEVFFVFSVSL